MRRKKTGLQGAVDLLRSQFWAGPAEAVDVEPGRRFENRKLAVKEGEKKQRQKFKRGK
jgi:hypothetical protein